MAAVTRRDTPLLPVGTRVRVLAHFHVGQEGRVASIYPMTRSYTVSVDGCSCRHGYFACEVEALAVQEEGRDG